MSALVYKILRISEWAAAKKAAAFRGSPDDLRDGFIHLSTADQLRATVEKHFSNESPLMLLVIATEPLGERLRWEVSRGGQKFPHLYAALPLGLAQSCGELRRGADGKIIFPIDIPLSPIGGEG